MEGLLTDPASVGLEGVDLMPSGVLRLLRGSMAGIWVYIGLTCDVLLGNYIHIIYIYIYI